MLKLRGLIGFVGVVALCAALVAPAAAAAGDARVEAALAAARAASGLGQAVAAADGLAAAWPAIRDDPAVSADDKVRMADALVSRLFDVQRFAEAEQVGRAGIGLLSRVKDPRIAAEGASVFPVPLTRLGKSAEAERLFRDAEALRLRVPGDTRTLQMANGQRLAVALAQQGKLDAATAVLHPLTPVALAADYPDPVRGLVIPQTLAGLYLLQGQPALAVPVLEQMKPRALQLWTSPRQKAEFLETLGEAYRMTKRTSAARDAYLQGLAVLSGGQAGSIVTEATLNANLARVLLLLGAPVEATARSDAALALIRTRAEAGRDPSGALSVQDEAMLRGVMAIDLDTRFAARSGLGGAARVAADEDAFARIQEAIVLAQPKGVARSGLPATASVADMRRGLRDGEAMLILLPGTDAVHVMGLTRDALAWHRMDEASARTCARIAGLRAGLAPGQPLRCLETEEGQAPSAAGFDAGAAHALWRDLLAPLGAEVLGQPRWIVSVAGSLAALPLGVLAMEPPADAASGQDFAQLAWVGRARALSYLPVPADLLRVRTAARPGRPGRLVGFGAPCTGEMAGAACTALKGGGVEAGLAALPADFSLMRSGPAGAEVDREALIRLPALPVAAQELQAVARRFPGRSAVAIGRDATETAVRAARVAPGAVLMFATHGLSAGALGLPEPSLVLTPPEVPTDGDDGLLTAGEVAALRFPDAFVILSACNTAGVRSIEALDPYAGFARAFFAAGARSLLVTQFEVPDAAAARLTTGTLSAMESRTGAAEALRRSVAAMLDDPGARALHHPRAWGAMVLVGAPD